MKLLEPIQISDKVKTHRDSSVIGGDEWTNYILPRPAHKFSVDSTMRMPPYGRREDGDTYA